MSAGSRGLIFAVTVTPQVFPGFHRQCCRLHPQFPLRAAQFIFFCSGCAAAGLCPLPENVGDDKRYLEKDTEHAQGSAVAASELCGCPPREEGNILCLYQGLETFSAKGHKVNIAGLPVLIETTQVFSYSERTPRQYANKWARLFQ